MHSFIHVDDDEDDDDDDDDDDNDDDVDHWPGGILTYTYLQA